MAHLFVQHEDTDQLDSRVILKFSHNPAAIVKAADDNYTTHRQREALPNPE